MEEHQFLTCSQTHQTSRGEVWCPLSGWQLMYLMITQAFFSCLGSFDDNNTWSYHHCHQHVTLFYISASVFNSIVIFQRLVARFQAPKCSTYFFAVNDASTSLQVYFSMLDTLLASEQLPEEYGDRCQVCYLTPDLLLQLFLVSKTTFHFAHSKLCSSPGHTLQ